ncbi:MAG TPA: lipid-A-disaccharide synthase-related protein [Dictyoglomaceae bacterium]|nr:lipid-A-disaccharide synthase-related protein [Dictyoglomaceae bacterium]
MKKIRFLALSNGYGEDYVAVNIIKELQNLYPHIDILAIPLVGEGKLYIQNNIPIKGPLKMMPSGGFIRDLKTLFDDINAGLLKVHWEKYKEMKNWAKEEGYVIAIGDVVPLAFSYITKRPYFFVNINMEKSIYTVCDEDISMENLSQSQAQRLAKKVYSGLELHIMKNKNCKSVFCRENLTNQVLKKAGVNSEYLGNPLMDRLKPQNILDISGFEDFYKVILLPGSRIPEAYYNFSVILEGVDSLISSISSEMFLFLTSLARSVSWKRIDEILIQKGFERVKEGDRQILYKKRNSYLIVTDIFSDCINVASLGIAMAGTATEQFVGLGKPAIAIPGKGPQYIYRFAKAQKKFLGPCLFLVDTPQEIPNIFVKIYKDERLLEEVKENAKKRVGEEGASQKIAQRILDYVMGG